MKIDELRYLTQDYNIDLNNKQAEKLLKHLTLVIEKNEQVNLTRISNMDEGAVLHILDSLLPCPQLPLSLDSQLNALDIGSGGGYPGIPLAILTKWQWTLIDSVGKKVSAINEFVDKLHLQNVRALHMRVEELALKERQSFSFVTARALAPLGVLIEYASPMLKQGGYLLAYKARPQEEELSYADKLANICGFEDVSRETFELPNNLGHRELFLYKKVRDASICLPRRPGEASKNKLDV